MPDLVTPEFLALDVLRIVSYLNLGFAGSLLLILLLSLVCCGFEAREDRKARRRRRASWSHAAGAAAIGLSCLCASSPAIAQSEQVVPTVEPTFTKLFGSDTVTIEPVVILPQKVALSPNGKWIVFPASDGISRPMPLWIVPVDGGAPSGLLEEGDHYDHQAVWFPGSDRIAFRSTRPSRPGQEGAYLMTVPVDPETGRVTGPPRQVSLETIPHYGFCVSPDGKEIAYVAMEGARRVLKRIPATGGEARVIAEHARIFLPLWTPDGRYIYYAGRDTEAGPQKAIRVALSGGAPEIVASPSHEFLISPDGQRVVKEISAAAGRPRVYEVESIRGQTIARFTLPKTMDLDGFAPDGESFLAIMVHTAAPLRVLPLDGGPAHQLTETRAYDIPLLWTADSREVLFRTDLNGAQVHMRAPRDGGAMRQVRLPGPAHEAYGPGPVFSTDLKYAMLALIEQDSGDPALRIVNLEDGSSTKVDHGPLWDRYRRYNPSRAQARFLFAEQYDDRFDFRAVEADGSTTLLRSFPAGVIPPPIGVHGDRIAYTQFVGDSTSMSLRIAWAGNPTAKHVLTVEGLLGTRGSNAPTWSPDGRMLAMAYGSPDGDGNDVFIVELNAAGELIGEPRILDLEPGPNWWWGLTWLPDGSGFVINGYEADQGPSGTNVWLVSLDPDVDAVPLTADDPNDTWAFALSPDGKHLAYSSDVHAGSSVWRVELGDVLTGGN